MISQEANPIEYSLEYFYSLSLFVGAVVCLLLAGLLLFDPDNDTYAFTPRYLRSRRLTALSLAVFGVGFFFQWLFMFKYTYLLAAHALSLIYFHVGGTLFSMSHTGLIDRHYLTPRVVIRDLAILIPSLGVYAASIWLASTILLYIGFALFFLHIGYLTWQFYRSFHRIYLQLGNYAEYCPNDSDRDVRWLFYSCHLIILFGIGGIAITLIFGDGVLPFIILISAGIFVFAYIYKALDGFGAEAYEAELNMQRSEQYLQTDEGKEEMKNFKRKRHLRSFLSDIPLLSGFVSQW